ncbi:metallophosphoesterase [Corynebacterium sp. NPDC060344]|uniref:metallophosphoesterase n=1 Tax=Corynebacterium sp. NPDC060344 TaxID=3347101 RepID=UPI00365D9C77
MRHLTGPFDIIGDVHGCLAELVELLERLGWRVSADGRGRPNGAEHPDGRLAVFVGDLVDRGPDTPGVLRLAMGMVAAGTALSVMGNHDWKLARALGGADVAVRHGLAESLEQIDAAADADAAAAAAAADATAGDPGFRERVRGFLAGLPIHLVLDGGALVVAHAGLKEEFHGRESGAVRSFALYGDVGGYSADGLPIRREWERNYAGRARVVYGHWPIREATWVNNTMCVDTGCVFGNALTALRYPELEVVDVAAHDRWWEASRPLREPAL